MVMTKEQIDAFLHGGALPADFLTRKEWEAHLGICKDGVLSLLNKLNDLGAVESQKKRVKKLGGGTVQVVAYKINKPAKKRGEK